ncbi:MAG: GNAT family N-acetyltransferase [Bacteroidota bacterium]
MLDHWIKHPTILTGELVDLIPLEEKHFAELYLAASDKSIWEFIPTNCSEPEKFKQTYSIALAERNKGNHYPFVIYHKATNKLIGSTRLFEIFPNDKKLEIGWTWIMPEYWASAINFECKLLLLTYCFEVLKTIRVQLRTDENNIRSRKAIEKIGAQFEGVFRNDKIKENGLPRNSVYFSIIDSEWEIAKEKITAQISKKKQW